MGFEELIKDIPVDARVLDVGAWGHEGINTTQDLTGRFENVDTLNIKKLEGVSIVADFYDWTPKRKYDLIVLDLDITNNIRKDWGYRGLRRIHGMLKKGGILINYILTDEDYGYTDEETQKMIYDILTNYWKSNPVTVGAIGRKMKELKDLFSLVSTQPDGERYNITWVSLRKV